MIMTRPIQVFVKDATWTLHSDSSPVSNVIHVAIDADLRDFEHSSLEQGLVYIPNTSPRNSPMPQLYVQWTENMPYSISKVIILSTARQVELYDHQSEYLGTFEVADTSESDSILLFKSILSFSSPIIVSSLSFKVIPNVFIHLVSQT